MKCKVFVDTNSLMNDKDGPLDMPFNNNISNLKKFLVEHKQDHNVGICIPEIVIRERLQQKLKQIDLSIATLAQQALLLNSLGHKVKPIKVGKNYKKILEDNIVNFLKENGVERADSPDVTSKELLDRAIEKIPPFKDNTAGFKDTLIYLSMEADALKNSADSYIFCTNDKGFDEELCKEFEKKTNKKLYLVPYIYNAQQKLDEILPLNLHLEERDKKIKNLIKESTGDLVTEVNKTINKNKRRSLYTGYSPIMMRNSSWTALSLAGEDKDAVIIGYTFDGLEFLNIKETSTDVFSVDVRLRTDVNYKDKENEEDNIGFGYVGESNFVRASTVNVMDIYSPTNGSLRVGSRSYRSVQKEFQMTLNCNLKSKTVNVIYVGEGLDPGAWVF